MSDFWAGAAGNAISSVTNLLTGNYYLKRQEEREDNAVWRRVQDMKRAGINPILAAGNPAAASAGGQPAGVDLGIAENLMNQATLNNMEKEGEKLDTENLALFQELTERQRNIDWYKQIGQPSDKPATFVQDIAQVMQALGSPNLSKMAENAIRGGVDAAKNVVKTAGNELFTNYADYLKWLWGLPSKGLNKLRGGK